jgi:hypothetical protein
MVRATKSLPLDKSVVTEFKIEVADIHLRAKQLKGAVASKVSRDSNFISGDYNITENQTLLMNNIKSVVAIYSYEPVLLSLTNASGSISDIPCNGLFLMHGSFDSVEVKSPVAGKMIRLTYLYS